MARVSWVVLLFVLAVAISSAQSETVRATARGGYQYIGLEGAASGSISGEIVMGSKPAAELMLVLKDVGGVTADAQNEAIIFLLSVAKFNLVGNVLSVSGKGTFQGEERQIEFTLTDAKRKGDKDLLTVKVIRYGRVEFQHTAKLDSSSITISRG